MTHLCSCKTHSLHADAQANTCSNRCLSTFIAVIYCCQTTQAMTVPIQTTCPSRQPITPPQSCAGGHITAKPATGPAGRPQAASPALPATTTATPEATMRQPGQVISNTQAMRRPLTVLLAASDPCTSAAGKAGSRSDCLTAAALQSSSFAAPILNGHR